MHNIGYESSAVKYFVSQRLAFLRFSLIGKDFSPCWRNGRGRHRMAAFQLMRDNLAPSTNRLDVEAILLTTSSVPGVNHFGSKRPAREKRACGIDLCCY